MLETLPARVDAGAFDRGDEADLARLLAAGALLDLPRHYC
jgi:hypothetical protein